ncbi:hypothetical protein WT72_17885 [Burkholderia pseudomultivorans]|uniref:FAD-dependent monooxygenase n=1 Tax=Burkholderia pseudomultivorans TaxID=1207504 RepID=UPI00075C5D52|nr:FAD-dependent monooxygenase [Burkholderia pseudomultivorans]KWI54703.1 hypothetical protein WT72_17885 [Burkholderia pseudomultivorans]
MKENFTSAPVAPVIIVGGGPVGLALACDLGRRKVPVLLLEQREDRPESAKMIVVGVRTMEFCRQLGLAEEVRHWGFPLDHGLDSVFVTSLDGFELGRVTTPRLSAGFDSEFSPERELPCPQTWFDPILKRHARSLPGVALRYQQRVDSLEQDEDGVTVGVTDVSTGASYSLRTPYVIGCDGYSSTVRQRLGISMRGMSHLDVSVSVYIRIGNFNDLHDKGDAYRYVFVGEQGTWAVLATMDGRDLWRLQLIGVDEDATTSEVIHDALRRCVGHDIEYEIEGVSRWVRKMVVADRFSDGRIYLAGDAAHAHPPNGGLGMNTGIQDAFDLGWKLAADYHGWGGCNLLASYDIERRPAASRAAQESLHNYTRLTGNTALPGLLNPGADGGRLRKELGVRLVAENEKAWHAIGVHLGYSYLPSPILVDDGVAAQPDDPAKYEPTSRPGSRAPHFWLQDGRSVLDLFGNGFVLLAFGEFDPVPALRAAAKKHIPFSVHRIDDPRALLLYEHLLVFVRPDGHVAWRGDELPADIDGLFDTVRGAGPVIAACRRV